MARRKLRSPDLDLIRLREGIEVGRFNISALFQNTGEGAIVQRWEPEYDQDFKASEEPDFVQKVSKRQAVQLINFADYDHDGHASEFYLQTEALPSGKSYGVVIGVSKVDSRLHAFGTASHRDKPLYMQKTAWDKLRDASGPVEVLDWACADHGSEIKGSYSFGGMPAVLRVSAVNSPAELTAAGSSSR